MSILDSIYPNGVPTKNSYSNASISDQEFYALLNELSKNLSGKYSAGVSSGSDNGDESGGFGQPGAEATYGAPTEAGTKAFNAIAPSAIKAMAMAAVPPLGGAKLGATIASLIAKYGGQVYGWLFGQDNPYSASEIAADNQTIADALEAANITYGDNPSSFYGDGGEGAGFGGEAGSEGGGPGGGGMGGMFGGST
jgi:hypothetical protein